MKPRYNYITIEGNIGAGKTSLANKLALEFNATLILEQFADNPFLPLFYEQPTRYAFPLELFFMAERFQQLKETTSAQEIFTPTVIADYLFIKSLLFSKINLSEDEYKLYSRIFNYIYTSLPQPELLVYLHADVPQLLKNISKRGREYEKKISGDYLQSIQETYFNYFKTQSNLKIVIVDTGKIDFINDESSYKKILELFQKEFDYGINYYQIV